MPRWCWLGSALLLLACGSPAPPAYARETKQAEEARRRGQHLAAAEHYQRAASAAAKPRDAEEARYRAAHSYARAGSTERAATIYRELAAQGPDAERRARADFALAELELDHGRERVGHTLLAAAIRRHPSSGLAARALRTHLQYLRAQGGPDAVLDYLAVQRQSLHRSELAEALEYLRARELDDAGRTAEARDAYLACAGRFPYPSGAYWDDALYRAAEKELALGAPQRALGHLQRLLSEQETAAITGSYQRARYAEGQLLIARIYRDTLRDPERARSELRKVWLNHPTSRLVDDALFQEATLARQTGDEAGSCAPLQIIVRELSDSRYAPCAHLLCPRLAPLPGRDCHDYIKREAGLP
jgi:tetratricopeptide (TPR) repeat protein